LQNGIRKCGVYPCDAAELLERLSGFEDINLSVEQSFIKWIIKRSEVTQNVRKPRKKLKVAPGTSYAQIEILVMKILILKEMKTKKNLIIWMINL